MTNTFCNNADDVKLDAMMKHLPLLHPSVDASHLFTMQDTFSCIVHAPDSEFSFLHESAIIYYHGVLFASWYHCHKDELSGYTPIMGKRSFDEGKTWSHLELLGHDKTEKLMYCPPVYGICKDKLYLFMNTMVAPDHIHSLELYEYSEDDKKFHFLWSKQIPFKINTNVCTLPNGRFMIPGRVG